jgi:apolipoprotein N-acyltransferase
MGDADHGRKSIFLIRNENQLIDMRKALHFFFLLIAAFATGILQTLAFPNFYLDWLAWFAFVPLLLGIYRAKLWEALIMSLVAGIIYCVGMSPIKDFPSLSMPAKILAHLYVSLYFGCFGLLLSFLLRRTKLSLLIAAPLWVSFEYARSNFFFLAFPGALLGHSQFQNLPLLQMASFTGTYGISFILMLVNAALADLIGYWFYKNEERKSLKWKATSFYSGLFVFAIVVVLWVIGWYSLPLAPSGKSLSVAVIQGNIPQEIKWNRQYREQILTKYENLTEEAAKANPNLIAWPEASTPGFVLKDLDLLQRMVSIVRKSNAHFLLGSAEYPKFDKALAKKRKSGNTALFFSPEGKILGQYIKIRLVPFGEYVPYEGIIPWPEFIVPKDMTSHISGEKPILFEINGTKFSTLICWEILFPDLVRSMIKEGANFVVNISNEAWFGRSATPHHILAMSVFRAVENRVNVVRATNTGVSCFIDPFGRITERITNGGDDLFVEGTLTREIILSPPGTFYTRYGDVFVYGCIAFSIGLILWEIIKKGSSDNSKEQ